MRLLAVAAVIACVLSPLPAQAAPESAIQPGARMTGPAGCTFNFVFEDSAGTKYIGTAGHCLPPGTGTRVSNPNGQFGTVVFTVFGYGSPDDFALIRVDDEHQHEVLPNVRHWGGPTAVMSEDEEVPGTPVLVSGYGMGFGQTPVTRPRAGSLIAMSGGKWSGYMPIIFGDSGGPIIDASGNAVGVVTGIKGYMYGTTVQRALQILADAGIHVSLVTAPLNPLV